MNSQERGGTSPFPLNKMNLPSREISKLTTYEWRVGNMQKELELLFEMFSLTPCNDVFHAIYKTFNLKAFKVQSSISGLWKVKYSLSDSILTFLFIAVL